MRLNTRTDLTPGQALSERVALEYYLFSVIGSEVQRFLVQSEMMARQALDAPTLLAAGNPFSFSGLFSTWAPVVERIIERITDVFLGQPDYFEGVKRRIRHADLPRDVYTRTVEVIRKGVDEEWDKGTFGLAIEDALAYDLIWETAAMRIARTEATAAFNYSTLQALSSEGVPSKMWVARMDARTRPTHWDANGQVQPVDSEFSVGVSHLMYPGDPSAPMDETANCRCVTVGVQSS